MGTPEGPARVAGDPPRGSRRRWRLPTGRAVVGSLLVVLAAAGVLMSHRGATHVPDDRYLVAARALSAGHALTTGDLASVAVDVPDGFGVVAAEAASDLSGRILRHDVAELEPLRPGDLLEPGRFSRPGQLEVALELPPARALAGTVSAGQHVDVLVTDPSGAGTTTVTRAVVVATAPADADGIGAASSVQVRIAVDDSSTAEAVVDAAVRSELTLVLPAPSGDGTST